MNARITASTEFKVAMLLRTAKWFAQRKNITQHHYQRFTVPFLEDASPPYSSRLKFLYADMTDIFVWCRKQGYPRLGLHDAATLTGSIIDAAEHNLNQDEVVYFVKEITNDLAKFAAYFRI